MDREERMNGTFYGLMREKKRRKKMFYTLSSYKYRGEGRKRNEKKKSYII